MSRRPCLQQESTSNDCISGRLPSDGFLDGTPPVGNQARRVDRSPGNGVSWVGSGMAASGREMWLAVAAIAIDRHQTRLA